MARREHRPSCWLPWVGFRVPTEPLDEEIDEQPNPDGQQVDHAVAFEVDQHRPVAVAAAPGPFVDRQHPHRRPRPRHDRWAVYYVYNRVANRPADVPNPRPDYVRSTNWAPLPLGTGDILAPAVVPAAAE